MLDIKLRKRKLKIDGMTCSGCEQKIKGALEELKGVQNVDADYKTGKLILEYDIVETALKNIEPFIEDLGYGLPSRISSRMHRSLIHDADKTARENYNTVPGCGLNCCDLNKDRTFKRR